MWRIGRWAYRSEQISFFLERRRGKKSNFFSRYSIWLKGLKGCEVSERQNRQSGSLMYVMISLLFLYVFYIGSTLLSVIFRVPVYETTHGEVYIHAKECTTTHEREYSNTNSEKRPSILIFPSLPLSIWRNGPDSKPLLQMVIYRFVS